MPAVQKIRMRLRALALVVTLLALAAGTSAAKSGGGLDGAPDQAAADVLRAARAQVGDAYQWGGNGPDAWDCSGLTSLWRSVGGAKGMPRVSRDQQAWAVPIPASQLRRGDLVFFGHPVTHVGLVSRAGHMLDASSSRKAVVERPIWKAGVVRYGRVPRSTMPKVRPWTPPPLPAAQPSAPRADSPAAAARPTTPARTTPAARPTKPVATTGKAAVSSLARFHGLPPRQARASSAKALKAAAGARAEQGSRAWDDVRLVRGAWRLAGGGDLPASRAGIVASGTRVALADVRVGDLVVYDRPDRPHLGIYLGSGYMVDASATLGKVVVRPVYDAPSIRFVRLR